MTDDALYDNKGQYEQVVPMVLEGERLDAVFDCKGKGTGFIAITDKRVMFYDKEFMKPPEVEDEAKPESTEGHRWTA